MRRLWRKLFGAPPTLVIPVPVIGPTAKELAKVSAAEWISDDDFLFGAQQISASRVIMRLPLDPIVAGAMYKGIRPPREGEVRQTVSYDPEKATIKLLRQAMGHVPRSIIGQKGTNVTK